MITFYLFIIFLTYYGVMIQISLKELMMHTFTKTFISFFKFNLFQHIHINNLHSYFNLINNLKFSMNKDSKFINMYNYIDVNYQGHKDFIVIIFYGFINYYFYYFYLFPCFFHIILKMQSNLKFSKTIIKKYNYL